jgi:hypothetical protein
MALRPILITATLTAGLLAAAGSTGAGNALAAPTSAPRQASTAWLNDVSASSRTNLWAVGAFYDANGVAPLAEHWNGKTWQHQYTDSNPPHNNYALAGIAATSAKNAWAVGTATSQYYLPLIYQWHGRAWAYDSYPTPGADGGAAFLNGVGTGPAGDAWAVGGYFPELTGMQTLILRWTGRKWIQVPSPSPGGSGSTAVNVLSGVGVLSPADAWAVGRSSTGQPSAHRTTLIEHWNGRQWATVPSPDPARKGCASDELSSVAATPTMTLAVGDYCGASLVLRLEDGQWRQMVSPGPPTGVSEHLASVTVTSAASAWAVGHIAGKMLILHWNGEKWATASAPRPADARSTTLAGVSAVSPSDAWAVGHADYRHGARKLLIEHWNGTRWRLVRVPNPPRRP